MSAGTAPHGKPPAGLECLVTFEAIDESNYVEFRTAPSGRWFPAKMSQEIVEHLLETQFDKYLKDVEAAAKDCAAAVRRLVAKGPPQFVNEPNALPVPEGDTHVDMLWFSNGNKEVSAALRNALSGAEREKLWDAQKETLKAMEAAEEAAKS